MKGQLSLLYSIPLAIGSIIGSGILFLPSLTYKVSGPDVLLSWILMTLLCIPGVLFCNELLQKLKPEDSNLRSLVVIGLGAEAGNATTLLLLGTVILGMPSAAVIAGEYVGNYLVMPLVKPLVSFCLITLAIVINLSGLKVTAQLSLMVSLILGSCAVYLIFATAQHMNSYPVLNPTFNLNNIFSGAVLAFWAFAGFENLTFLAREFKNPKRDLLITVCVSILVCGSVYGFLVANYTSIVPYYEINELAGLQQMAEASGLIHFGFLLALFAFVAVLLNLISWTSGMARLVSEASSLKLLPTKLQEGHRSILFLGTIFYFVLFIELAFPITLETILKLVSTNFLLVYFMLTLSFIAHTSSSVKRGIAAMAGVLLLVTLSYSSYLLVYSFIIFLLTFLRSKEKQYV